MKLKTAYDVVIIGAGSAGCVLANRLTADPSVDVLLLEAGLGPGGLYVEMPIAMAYAWDKHAWTYESGPEPALGGRMVPQPRGKALGGSSAINGMVYNRGNPLDFDGWAQKGLPGWDYAHCLPYFKKMEFYDRGADAWRGGGGPMKITTAKAEDPFFQRFLEAGRQAGHHVTEDQNGYRQEGLHVAQVNTHDGKRWSAYDGYLKPVMRRPNLTVATGAFVRRIVVSAGRATGVEFERDGDVHAVDAEREVVLSAGAYASPHLLMLSGIGRRAHLEEHGIACVNDLPGVGENLEDHAATSVQVACEGPNDIAGKLGGRIGQTMMGARWLLTRSGLAASNLFEVGGFIRTTEAETIPDLQYEFLPVLWDHNDMSRGNRFTIRNGFQYSFYVMRPRSKGRIRLRSADPHAALDVVTNFLQDPADQRVLIEGLRRTREILAQEAWSSAKGVEVTPGPDAQTDAEILAWLRRDAGTEYHPACTCRMGVDDMAVVDAEGLVHGMSGLRVVDASIMPGMITANLGCAVIMMAEKIADAMLGSPPLPPDQANVYRGAS